MSDDSSQTGPSRLSPAEIESAMGQIKKMILVGVVFAAVGYLLLGMALVLELTEFHPLLEEFFSTHTNTSLACGAPERSGAINDDLATIHSWPSTLLWLKLGGVGHILVGIFVSLVAIVRTLSLVPHRLYYAMN